MSCAKSELCIFDGPLPQVVVDQYNFEEIFPVNSITGGTSPNIEFHIQSSNTDYLDLNDTLLYVKVKVLVEGKDMGEKADVTPCNYWFHTLFSDAILSLNNEVVDGGNGTYSVKAIIESILNYNTDTKVTSLSSIGYDNEAEDRKKWIEKSASFSMCGSLQLSFFDQPKYLLPGVNVHLKLIRNASSYSLKSTVAKASIRFEEAKLLVRRVKVEPSVLMGHNLGLNTQNARYPIRKTKLAVYALSIGSLNVYKEQLFGDEQLPKFVLVTFQTNEQNTGDFSADCALFEHYNVGNITLSRGNDFRETYTQDFSANDYMQSYTTSLIRNLGHLDKNLNCGVTYAEFKDEYPFFTFVLAPDFDITTTQLPRQGNLKLEIKFRKALEKAGSLLVYGVFDSEIQINKNKTVLH